MTKRRLLWIGDACVSSGFARSTHKIVDVLRHTFDVAVLGMNYFGDPHPYPYPIYPCLPAGQMGVNRVKELIQKLGPSIVVVQQDPWNIQAYLQRVGNVPTVGIIAVDGKHCQGTELNGLATAIFWTAFGRDQARLGGYTGSSTVIPLGVDLEIYHPLDRSMIRERMNLLEVLTDRGLPTDTFIVGTVAKNQPRKRLDLTLQYFSQWVHTKHIADAGLWLHVAPTQEASYDLEKLGRYYGIADRIFVPEIHPTQGITEVSLARIYAVFDAYLTTTVGEGMDLPVMEAMACGVPCILPDWSALGEWAREAAWMVPCTTTAVAPGINTVGGIMDAQGAVEALDMLYRRPDVREKFAVKGMQLTAEPAYRWDGIGAQVTEVIEQVLYANPVGDHAHRSVEMV